MSVCQCLHRVVVSNLLSLYYSIQMLFVFALVYLKNPFASPWAQKLKLEPPARLTDPKYGVHKYIKVNVSIYLLVLCKLLVNETVNLKMNLYLYDNANR